MVRVGASQWCILLTAVAKTKNNEKAIKFITENVDMRTVEYTTDMAYTTRMPCALISPRLADDVYDLLVEYGQEHDLKEDWWQEYGEIEDWIKNLK